jgi:hypothetical protein
MYSNIIIIPYRNRKEHLETFIKNVIPLFDKYLKPYKLVIVEQEEGKLFNRGKLLNIGFNEYKDKSEFFFTHDVDIIPNENCVKELYNKNEYDVIRIFNGHNTSLGGIIKFSRDSFLNVNGLPNHIWGWGIEDRALYYRYIIMNKILSPNYTNVINFNILYHTSNVHNYTNEKLAISNKEDEIFNCNDKNIQLNHIMSSGLNNLDYKILNRYTVNENIELIKVSI